jgi:PAS domain-containing protein
MTAASYTPNALHEAEAALQRGDRAVARRFAQLAAMQRPDDERPWLILAQLAGADASVAYCQRAVQANPASQRAREALKRAQERISRGALSSSPTRYLPVEDLISAVSDTSRPIYARPVTAKPRLNITAMLISILRQAGAAVLGILLLVGGSILLRGVAAGHPEVTPTATPARCDLALHIAGQAFAVQSIPPAPTGNWRLPADAGQAFWVEGTNRHAYVLLPANPANRALLQSLQVGDTAAFTNRRCNTTVFSLGQVTQGVPDPAGQLDQNSTRITLYVPAAAEFPGILLEGSQQGEELRRASTPDPDAQLLEISFEGILTSSNDSAVTFRVIITNTAKNPVQIHPADASLTPEGTGPLDVLSAEPGLPLELKAGAAQEIRITFPHPSIPSATLKVFNAEFAVDGY